MSFRANEELFNIYVNMKEITPEESKKLQLDILINVARFCEEHDIKYSLAYGTLIGAIRHKGFIPWDDDIDIIMMRDEYERFVDTYHDDKYVLIFGEEKGNHLHVVVNDMRTIINSQKKATEKFYKGGVWVDIFPIDYVPEDETSYRRFMKTIWLLCKLQRVGELYDPQSKLLSRLAHPFLRPFQKYFGKLAKRKMLQYGKSQTKTVANVSLWYLNYPSFPASFMNEYVNIEFEGHVFKSIKRYDEFLRGIYGDYMQLPPENERIPKHSYTTYWRD